MADEEKPLFSPEEKQKYLGILRNKCKKPCPRCSSANFILTDGFCLLNAIADISVFVLGGKAIPALVTVCSNCGFVAMHALGPLGLLPKDQKGGDANGKPKTD